jgi:transglutaminase-like putative cysteine protease
MKAPAGLVGAALLLWGASIGLPWLGAVAALAFEALRWSKPTPTARTAALLTPLVRLSTLLAVALLALFIGVQGAPQALYAWLRWLPLVLWPLAALQLAVHTLTATALLRALRPRAQPPGEERVHEPPLDLSHGYAALVLAAAGTGSSATPWLYAAYVLIVGWALLARVARGRRAAAAAMVALAAGIGYGTYIGIAALQGQVEEWGTEFIADWISAPPDPFRERTRIGDYGKVKLSDRIVMRVTAPEALAARGPLLLHESIFDRYRGGEWSTVRRSATPARLSPPERSSAGGDAADNPRWRLSEGAASAQLAVRRTMPGGEGLLPLPLGTRTVSLPAQQVEVLASGAVRVRGTPRFVAMQVAYDESGGGGAPDATADLEVPAVLAATLADVVRTLRRPAAAATVAAVQDFFAAHFAYTLDLGDTRSGDRTRRTLPEFLLRERKGHCEYFATATVLLLRQAGIAARYVGGYSVQDYSEREQAFVVRARHAHAWAQAWVDGRWVNVDTTPARWAETEADAARGPFGPLLDLLSWLVDRALLAWQAWAGAAPSPAALGAAALGVLLAGLLLVAGWRLAALRLRMRSDRNRGNTAARDEITRAWAHVEAEVARSGHARARDETVQAWVRRLDAALAPSARGDAARADGAQAARGAEGRQASLRELATHYYRVRFDPAAPPADAAAFVSAALRWTAPRPSAARP